jgi:hypothetical protein
VGLKHAVLDAASSGVIRRKLPMPRIPLMSWVLIAYCSVAKATASAFMSRASSLLFAKVSHASFGHEG